MKKRAALYKGDDDTMPKHVHIPRTLYFVEANIGCGKSTLLAEIAAASPSCRCIPEPVDAWTNHLTRFSSSMPYGSNWALPLQALILSTKIERLLGELATLAEHETEIVVERSIKSSDLFGTAMLLDADDCCAYKTLSARYQTELAAVLKEARVEKVHFLYLRADPATCMARKCVRDRACEKDVALEYMTKLHGIHEAEFGRGFRVVSHLNAVCPISVIDANGSRQQVLNETMKILLGL